MDSWSPAAYFPCSLRLSPSPLSTLNAACASRSTSSTVCPWKGTANRHRKHCQFHLLSASAFSKRLPPSDHSLSNRCEKTPPHHRAPPAHLQSRQTTYAHHNWDGKSFEQFSTPSLLLRRWGVLFSHFCRQRSREHFGRKSRHWIWPLQVLFVLVHCSLLGILSGRDREFLVRSSLLICPPFKQI